MREQSSRRWARFDCGHHARRSAGPDSQPVDVRVQQAIQVSLGLGGAQPTRAGAWLIHAALAQHRSLPLPEELSISYAAYLNGLAEAVGELRRYVLDQLRHGNYDDCETFLRYMDDIYALLISVDFPDAITGGLRRTTDAARGILEKTRGDLTSAISQAHLQQSMMDLQQELQKLDSTRNMR